jgi:hypothetical protein
MYLDTCILYMACDACVTYNFVKPFFCNVIIILILKINFILRINFQNFFFGGKIR